MCIVMNNKELYISEELELFEAIENGETVSFEGDEYAQEKAMLTQATVNTIEKRKKVIISDYLKQLKHLP